MNRSTATASILLLCCCTGCLSVCNNAYQTLIREPKQFSWRKDRCESRTLYASWAAGAWAEQRSNGVPCQSSDYVLGFQDGFVEYCYAGGSGEPPPIPPRPYWNSLNRVAPLNKSAYEWFDGYRLGARVARDGGYRAQAVVPASASLCSKGGVARSETDCPCAAGQPTIMPQPAPAVEPVPAPAPGSAGEVAPDELTLPALTEPLLKPAGKSASAAVYRPATSAGGLFDAPPLDASGPDTTARPLPSTTEEPNTAEGHSNVRRFGNEFLR